MMPYGLSLIHVLERFWTFETIILAFSWTKTTILQEIFIPLWSNCDKKTMTKRLLLYFLCVTCVLAVQAQERWWTVADGLPTGEVHQMVELPNGQMLVNCEGVFCLSNGRGFQTVPCDYGHAYNLPHFSSGYAQQWQGDSLLWLRDFYRVFLFDARSRSFRHDIEKGVTEAMMKNFQPSSLTVSDRQGGRWQGTTQNGILYTPPKRQNAELIEGDNPLIGLARSTTDSRQRVWHCKADGLECVANGAVTRYGTANVAGLPYNRTTFIQELGDGRFLLCDSMCLLGYLHPDRHEFVSLSGRLPALAKYRHFVGACPLDDKWVAVYTQNGALLLDTENDTLATFPCSDVIERYSSKYNCMLKDGGNNLWVGTQNGLFKIERCLEPAADPVCRRIECLANNCIRSLVADGQGNVWAGTSYGVSRITPTVVNYGPEDGIPAVNMMERAAMLTTDGRLVFVFNASGAVAFRPEWFRQEKTAPFAAVITAVSVDGEMLPVEKLTHTLSFDYGTNNLAFQFSALNYATPSHTRYRYRLVNLEDDWQFPAYTDGSLCEVEYRALPPGSYTFEVQTAIDDGKWGEVARQKVVIHPPFWLTWWAKFAYVLVGCFLLAFGIASYLKRKRQKLERENDQRVNQLFELREEARHQFAENTNIDPQKISVNSEEEVLAERMLKAIEAHLSDDNYGVDQLAQDVFMSRSALYSKLRNMLGISPADFIRNVRLKRAAQLLCDTDLPIGEIADRVGYNTHKAFVANFKKMFGILPSEYRNLPKDRR